MATGLHMTHFIMALLSILAFCHTWLHMDQHCPMAPQNLQNWNHEIWNIFLRFVGFNLDVEKNTKPMITIQNSTKTMPENIHVDITNGIYVNTDLTVCIPFLIWHRWPHIIFKPLVWITFKNHKHQNYVIHIRYRGH